MYQYASDVGVTSWPQILADARLSGLIGSDPLLRDTNDYDGPPAGGGYHLTGNAVDFGDDEENGSPQQSAFAIWVANNFGPYSLEIIHTNADGSGVYWKLGQPVSAAFYGAATVAEHRNHVHWAITLSGLSAGMTKMGDIISMFPTIDTNHSLDMRAPWVLTLMAVLQNNGMLIAPVSSTPLDVLNAAVKRLQQIHHLTVDGICGQTTWKVAFPFTGQAK
jgi:hypothetical protein